MHTINCSISLIFYLISVNKTNRMSAIYEELKRKFEPFNCIKNENEINLDNNCSKAKFPMCTLIPEEVGLLKCAILVVLFRSNNQYFVILNIRGFNLKAYPGEICFPGGKFDEKLDKTFADTAFREAEEEINLKRENLKFICQLCPIVTPIGHYIAPIVCILTNTTTNKGVDPCEDTLDIVKGLKPNQDEVESIFWIPFSYFFNKSQISQFSMPFELDNSLEKFKNLFKINFSTYTRVIINIEDDIFENKVKPVTQIIYGMNATVLLMVVMNVENRFDLLELSNFQIKNVETLRAYGNMFRLTAYIIYKNNLLIKQKKMIKSKL